MSVEITRLRPADIWKLQQQTADDAAVAQVIEALQAGHSTVESPLNTICPTCQVAGVATGFLTGSFMGTSYKYACTTCGGYLMYFTEAGAETPPTNPFGSPVTSNMLPADLKQALALNNSATLDLMAVALRNNLPVTLGFDCPECVVDAVSTGWTEVQLEQVMCWLCQGQQKTQLHYEKDGDNIIVV